MGMKIKKVLSLVDKINIYNDIKTTTKDQYTSFNDFYDKFGDSIQNINNREELQLIYLDYIKTINTNNLIIENNKY